VELDDRKGELPDRTGWPLSLSQGPGCVHGRSTTKRHPLTSNRIALDQASSGAPPGEHRSAPANQLTTDQPIALSTARGTRPVRSSLEYRGNGLEHFALAEEQAASRPGRRRVLVARRPLHGAHFVRVHQALRPGVVVTSKPKNSDLPDRAFSVSAGTRARVGARFVTER